MKTCGHELTRADYSTDEFGHPYVDCQQCAGEAFALVDPISAAMRPTNRGIKTEVPFEERSRVILDELNGRTIPVSCSELATVVGRSAAALYCDLKRLVKKKEIARKRGPRPDAGGMPAFLYFASAA